MRMLDGLKNEWRKIVGRSLAVMLMFVGSFGLTQRAQATPPVGEFAESDEGTPPYATRPRQIVFKNYPHDFTFGFLVPKGYDAVHIRWGVTMWKSEQQFEFEVNDGSGADKHRWYTIHHVLPGNAYTFKVQYVKKAKRLFEKDYCGSWFETAQTYVPPKKPTPKPPPAPPPAPAPAPPPKASPTAPRNISAIRNDSMEIHVFWTADNSAEWYVVERRVTVGPSLEGPGSTPWAAASGKLKQGTTSFVARYPLLPDDLKLKNFFRVVASNSSGQAASTPVAEHWSKTSTKIQLSNPSPVTTGLPKVKPTK